jgi:hypothetical protein
MAVVAALAIALVLAGCATAGQPSHAVLAAYIGQSRVTLAETSGATSITVGTGPAGGALVRAWTPPGSGVRPVLRSGRELKVVLVPTGERGPAALHIVLNPAVRWRLVFAGGAPSLRLNLASAQLWNLDITAGFSMIHMRLPAPAGQVAVDLAAGASWVDVGVPRGVPARLALAGGAGFVTIGGRTYTGIAGGTTFTTPGRATSGIGYLINATAGVSSIRIAAP